MENGVVMENEEGKEKEEEETEGTVTVLPAVYMMAAHEPSPIEQPWAKATALRIGQRVTIADEQAIVAQIDGGDVTARTASGREIRCNYAEAAPMGAEWEQMVFELLVAEGKTALSSSSPLDAVAIAARLHASAEEMGWETHADARSIAERMHNDARTAASLQEKVERNRANAQTPAELCPTNQPKYGRGYHSRQTERLEQRQAVKESRKQQHQLYQRLCHIEVKKRKLQREHVQWRRKLLKTLAKEKGLTRLYHDNAARTIQFAFLRRCKGYTHIRVQERVAEAGVIHLESGDRVRIRDGLYRGRTGTVEPGHQIEHAEGVPDRCCINFDAGGPSVVIIASRLDKITTKSRLKPLSAEPWISGPGWETVPDGRDDDGEFFDANPEISGSTPVHIGPSCCNAFGDDAEDEPDEDDLWHYSEAQDLPSQVMTIGPGHFQDSSVTFAVTPNRAVNIATTDTASPYTMTGNPAILSNKRQLQKPFKMVGVTANPVIVDTQGDVRMRVTTRDGQERTVVMVGVLLGPPSAPELLVSAQEHVHELHISKAHGESWLQFGGKRGPDVEVHYERGHLVFQVDIEKAHTTERAAYRPQLEHIRVMRHTEATGTQVLHIGETPAEEGSATRPEQLGIKKDDKRISADRWHARLGHCNELSMLRALGRAKLLRGQHTLSKCDVCARSRMRTAPKVTKPKGYRKREEFETYERIHVDIVGKMQVPSAGGAQYYLLIRDHATGIAHVYGMKRKSEIRNRLRWHIQHIVRPVRPTAKIQIQTDTEKSLSDKWHAWAATHDCEMRQSCPYSQWQNGHIESFVAKIKATTRALLCDAKLPLTYHAYAIRHAVLLANSLPRDAKEARSPHLMAYGKEPNLSRFRKFGCVAIRKNQGHELQALEDRGIPGIYLGHPPHGYKDGWYHSLGKGGATSKVAISRSMIFFEDDERPPLQHLAQMRGTKCSVRHDLPEVWCGDLAIPWSDAVTISAKVAEGFIPADQLEHTSSDEEDGKNSLSDSEGDDEAATRTTRPKGRAPSGKVWNYAEGKWTIPDVTSSDDEDGAKGKDSDGASDEAGATWDYKGLYNSACNACDTRLAASWLTTKQCRDLGAIPCRSCNFMLCGKCVPAAINSTRLAVLARGRKLGPGKHILCRECVTQHGEELGIKAQPWAAEDVEATGGAGRDTATTTASSQRPTRKTRDETIPSVWRLRSKHSETIAEAAVRFGVKPGEYLEWLRRFAPFKKGSTKGDKLFAVSTDTPIYPQGTSWPDPASEDFLSATRVTTEEVFCTIGVEQHVRSKREVEHDSVTVPALAIEAAAEPEPGTIEATMADLQKEFMVRQGSSAAQFALPEGLHLEAKIPANQKQARKSPYHLQWKAAELRELQGLVSRGTFRQVPKPQGRNLIGLRFVYDLKRHPDRTIDKFKARLVAQGFSQIKGEDYDLTAAPTMHVSTLRTIVALAARDGLMLRTWDVSQAFLQTVNSLEHELYCRMPPGFEAKGDCMKLNCGIYGLKQGAQVYSVVFARWLAKMGWNRSPQDPSIYYRGTMKLGVHVDDMLGTSNDTEELDRFDRELKERFSATGGEECEFILGTHIEKQDDGCILMHQERYVTEILERFGMQDCKPADSPIDAYSKEMLLPVTEEDAQECAAQTLDVRAITGACTWLASMTRPDIGFAVHCCQRQSHRPGMAQYNACIRLLRYLKGTPRRGILYHPKTDKSIDHRLIAFSDADYAGPKTVAGGDKTVKSQSGAIVYLAGGPVCWSSRLQRLTAQSSCESEFYALVSATKEVIAMRQLLSHLGEHSALEGGTVLATDNTAAITCSIQPTSLRNRHFCIGVQLVRDEVIHGRTRVHFVDGDENPADLYTKSSISALKFKQLSEMVLGEKPFPVPQVYIA